MGYRDFKVDGIEYRLILELHGTTRKEPIDGLDAIILETGSVDHEKYAGLITADKRLYKYLKKIKEENIPLFSVDNIGKSELLSLAINLAHISLIPLMSYGIAKIAGADDNTAKDALILAYPAQFLVLLPAHLFNNKISEASRKLNSYLSLIRQNPNEELRNALAAKKIKKGVIPILKQQYPEKFKHKNPRIGIIYGAAHSSIKECLQSDSRTNFSLRLHKHAGADLISDRRTLNDIGEYTINGDYSITYTKFKCNVFD